MGVTFITVAVILSVVFTVPLVDARDRVRAAETEKLQVGERAFSRFEAQRQRDQLVAISALSENSNLKAALDSYFIEHGGADTRVRGATTRDPGTLQDIVASEVARIASIIGANVVAALDPDGHVFAAGGAAAARWPAGAQVRQTSSSANSGIALVPSGAFRYSSAPLLSGDRSLGSLVVATSLDTAYAEELSRLADAGIVVTVKGVAVAGTVGDELTRAVVASASELRATMALGGEEYAIQTLMALGDVRIYMLSSIDAVARGATRSALLALGTVALWAFVLAGFASLWLARTLTDPIHRVSDAIATMTAARDFSRTVELTGKSRELDALATSFNELMGGLSTAEAETRAAYLGTIRALAAALDARDPYTAGHSERVSQTSVVIARQLRLHEGEVAVIRLGALLHDIGKIGLADDVLQKAEPLSADEYEQIKRHPALGARILRQVPFLEPHLSIVELHPERPDGHGYPFGLRGDDIPMAARIVHVADAYDAMTSARAYRPARPPAAAMAELHLYAGTQFDVDCVRALHEALRPAPVAARGVQDVAS